MSANSTPRRVPPPCWTKHETLALIKAYRDKWFSVNRGNLRASDWDAVAASVANSSASDPPKSSLQCRHKIEKLRKRYRMEKQRCLDLPGTFFSSWDLFPLLDAMFMGSSSSGSKRDRFVRDDCVDDHTVNDVKSLEERYLDQGFDQPDGDLGFRARKLIRIVDDDCTDNGFSVKYSACDVNSVSVAFRPKSFGRAVDGKFKAHDLDFHRDYSKNLENFSQLPKLKSYGKVVNGDSVDHVDGYSGFPLKAFGNVASGFEPKIYSETGHMKASSKCGYGVESVVNRSVLPPMGFRLKNYSKIDGIANVDVSSKVVNAIDGVNKSGNCSSSAVKVVDPISELASAVKLSVESFVKVEKMKMEMAMEIEKNRMKTMVKHHQMIIESQRQIVDGFMKTISEAKRKRKKAKGMDVSSHCQDKIGETQVGATECESIGKSGIAKEDR